MTTFQSQSNNNEVAAAAAALASSMSAENSSDTAQVSVTKKVKIPNVATAPQMQTVIMGLFQKFGIDFYRQLVQASALTGLFTKYASNGVKVVLPNSVAREGESEGEQPKPAQSEHLQSKQEEEEWLPIGVGLRIYGGELNYYAFLDKQDKHIEYIFNSAAQLDLANFVKTWTKNLVQQGWLENSLMIQPF